MFQRLSKHITPAMILAFVALVFAVTGGAFAASGGGGGGSSHGALTASAAKKKSTKKKSKPTGKPGPRGPVGPAGKNGANGANGAQGLQGPAGAAGAKGETGAAGVGSTGAQGATGAPGTDGASVTSEEVSPGEAACAGEGGAEFEVGSGTPTYACNGKSGFTKTLPSGETETGAWSISVTDIGSPKVYAAISFAIPLHAASTKVFYFTPNETTEIEEGIERQNSKCTGTVEDPKAPAGTLCVFTSGATLRGAVFFAVLPLKFPSALAGDSPAGAFVAFEGTEERGEFEEPSEVFAAGSWAVTAP